jgi:hypothetical protein
MGLTMYLPYFEKVIALKRQFLTAVTLGDTLHVIITKIKG